MQIWNLQFALPYKIVKSQLFNNFAKIYFKELDKNFLPTKKWLKDYFKDLINKSNINIKWILFEENKIGFYILEKLKNKYTDKKKILVKDLFIIKKFRRKKIGKNIVFQIINFTKKNKIKKLVIEILASNKKVASFWKNFKFKKSSDKYILKI